jgi:hypothetical protein
MPKYYFDVSQGEGSGTDEEGTDLPGPTEAEHEACVTALQIAKDTLADCIQRGVSVRVRDEAGKHLVSATASLKIDKNPTVQRLGRWRMPPRRLA